MSAVGWSIVGAAVLPMAVLPYWLPGIVVALRVRIFARVGGVDGVRAPGPEVPAEEFKRVYGHPAADGRSRGAALSDLFWYWLAPGPEVHQEHLEPGPRYDDVARTTRRILAGFSREQWIELVGRCTRNVLDELTDGEPTAGQATHDRPEPTAGEATPGGPREHPRTARTLHVRLRDLMMPVWAEVYYEVVFREPCPRHVRNLITDHANDVVDSIKCLGLRHMDRRARLTEHLRARLADDPPPGPLPDSLDRREQAYYLQGTFFNTAVVQMSEASAHLLLALATHRDTQTRLQAPGADPDHLDRIVDETLLHFPLFGVAHRITSGEIPREGREPIPTGSVLLFNYPEYQGSRGLAFDPDRWLDPDTRPAGYIPFGVTANRPCPARGFALLTLRVAAEETLRRFRLDSSAQHTRSLPNRGPCLLIPRTDPDAPPPRRPRVRLAVMRLTDRWAAVPRSLTQLVFGAYMVRDARRRGLCRAYFGTSSAGPASAGPAPSVPAGR
ncbi:cytochrome P450 [Embleya hyalina]|uniref:Cytochrome P450 n=1 Tax=Embleya hyalina TaxID=516124 RepID=A0A401Z2Y3_9ACTN|nr:cytochrome P450 [Embleya hyalina]GCE01255.1 cytochrome P450 [Embleya hyalina]